MRYLRSLNSSLDILEILGTSTKAIGVTDLARASGLNKSTVHGIVANLAERGYVKQIPETGRYQLWTRAWQLGMLAEKQIRLKEVARPFLEELTDLTGEGSLLSSYCGSGLVIYLDTVASKNPIRAYVEIGALIPCYCVATGKILMAQQDDEEIESILKNVKRYTSHTLIDRDKIKRQLEEIRVNGWASNIGEYRDDVIGVAAPVKNGKDDVVAAIGVSGPAYRITGDRIEYIKRTVMSIAEKLSTNLG